MTIEYAAGFIDADGCIGLSRNTARLECGGIYEPNMVALAELFGGRVWLEDKPCGLRKKPFYRWVVYGKSAISAIERLLPHLAVKRVRATYVLENCAK
jgi:hypothetical protein